MITPNPSIPPAPAPVGLADPAALVAALPVMLGFRPRESLVLAALLPGEARAMRLGLALRVDLPAPRDVAAVCEGAAESLLLGEPAAAVVVVVGGVGPPRGARGARDAAGTRGDVVPRRDVAAAVVEALQARGVPARTVVWAQECAAGARWACYDDCGCGGAVPDPRGTELAALAVSEGQVVYEDRAELERLVAPAPRRVLRRRERLLVRALEAAENGTGAEDCAEGCDERPEEDHTAEHAGDHAEAVAALAHVDRAIGEAAEGRLALDDATVVTLARALALPEVRDEALHRCAGPDAVAAEQLWAALARETPEPEAAVPAALLAVSALLRGRGALANIALDRAESAWPGHRLTTLLRAATDAGVRPDDARAWLAGC